MDETNRNTSEIIMQVHNLFRFADPVFRLVAVGTVKLIQFFARMVREKKLSAIELEDFGEFLKATDGKYDITTRRLFEEGNIQDNCVFSYRDKIWNDRSTIYHWSNNDRSYTIEFRCCFNGRYLIEQMLQAKNAPANPSDIEYVRKCLGSRLGNYSESIVRDDLDLFEVLENFEDVGLPF